VKIMTAIRAVRTAPRERSSPQNGLPELVPYVYRQQKHRNTYAARIAQRNSLGWWLPPVLPGSSTEMSGRERDQRG
jgi:hypothetical protein